MDFETFSRQIYELERRRQVAEGLSDILTVINSNTPLSSILEYIVEQARRLLGADAAAIYRIDLSKRILSIQASNGLPEDYVLQGNVPLGKGATGRTVVDREPVMIFDIAAREKDGELDNDFYRGEEVQLLLELLARDFRSLLSAPLIIKDEAYGALTLYYQSPYRFVEEEVSMAVSFCNQAALAIENARLRAQVEQAAAAAERNRLARDLHDSVTQTLFSANLVAEVLPTVWKRSQMEGEKALEELRLLTRGALAEMRTLLLELRPASLNTAPIEELLQHLCEASASRLRIPVELEIEVRPALPPEVQVAFYRIAQEALNNITKHAAATRVQVRLAGFQLETEQETERELQGIRLSLVDNGRGFTPGGVDPGRLGIGIMQERAEAIGARLAINSRPEEGTEVVVSWMPEKFESSS